MQTICHLVILCVLLCGSGLTACKRPLPTHFEVGLESIETFDHSRTFDTTGTPDAPDYYRPIRIDLFYPSLEKLKTEALSYQDILNMYARRMNFTVPLDSCSRISLGIADMIAEYLHIDSASKILQYKTQIHKGLQHLKQQCPLIIYAAGMNGSSWENPVLFQRLAAQGYVVAAISSVGLYPGYMSTAMDMHEQVQDILFALQQAKTWPFADTAHIGLLSWSLGGTAIVEAAMHSPHIKCLLSMDGTEIHYYGYDTAWDKEYNQIMALPPFQPAKVTIPYLYLSSEHPKDADSLYFFPMHIRSKDNYFLKFNGAIHEDFSSLPTIAKSVAPKLGNMDSGRHALIGNMVLVFFNQYLKQVESGTTPQYIHKLMREHPEKYSRHYGG